MPTRYINIPLEGPSRPLSTEQVLEWVSYDWSNPHQHLIANLPLVSGLKFVELHHFDTENWMIETSDPPAIVVPPRLPCRAGRHGGTCKDCKEHRDGVWKPRYSTQSRRIPLHDSHMCDFLDSYTSLYDLPMPYDKFSDQTSRVKEAFDREVSIDALRNTFGIILAAKGHSDDTVRRFLGFTESSTYPIGFRKMADWKRYDGLEAFGTGEFRE